MSRFEKLRLMYQNLLEEIKISVFLTYDEMDDIEVLLYLISSAILTLESSEVRAVVNPKLTRKYIRDLMSMCEVYLDEAFKITRKERDSHADS